MPLETLPPLLLRPRGFLRFADFFLPIKPVFKYTPILKFYLKYFLPKSLPRLLVIETLSTGASLVVQWLRLHLPLQGVQVQSLVRELRSHMPCENENINQNQYCNKFNKDFKGKKKRNSLYSIVLLYPHCIAAFTKVWIIFVGLQAPWRQLGYPGSLHSTLLAAWYPVNVAELTSPLSVS